MMIHLSLIIILALCGVQSMKNGRRTYDAEFPFVVAIEHYWFYLCSGTIIDKYHIVTVAHMVAPYSVSGLLVVPGMSVIRKPYHTALTVKNVFPHPDYQELILHSSRQNDIYWENDIAIIRLTEPLASNFLNGLVPLSSTNLDSYPCFECTMISWNYPNERNLEMVIKMWDIVYIVENNRCVHWNIHVLKNQKCFIDLFETAFISTEDLGSPIICGDSIIGLVVKEARQGEASSPAIFLSTLNYASFISEIINGGEINVQPGEFPYMVSIWHANKHVCGGVIVNSDQVLTTAHCLQGSSRVYSQKTLKIAAGSHEVSTLIPTTQWYLVSNLEIFPYSLPSHCLKDPSLRMEQNIGLITLSTPFLWSPTIQRFKFEDTDDFSTEQLCQVLHWTQKYTEMEIAFLRLTKTTAVLVDYDTPLVELKRFQIAAKELYSMNSPQSTDIGNPIICGGHMIGIMVENHSINVKSKIPEIIFFRLRPYAFLKFLNGE